MRLFPKLRKNINAKLPLFSHTFLIHACNFKMAFGKVAHFPRSKDCYKKNPELPFDIFKNGEN